MLLTCIAIVFTFVCGWVAMDREDALKPDEPGLALVYLWVSSFAYAFSAIGVVILLVNLTGVG